MNAMKTPAPPSDKAADPVPADAASPVTADSVVARLADFPDLESVTPAAPLGSLNQLLDVSVCVTAELGRVTMPISDILKLGAGSIVGLERGVSEPVDLLVQGVPFARGEVVVIADRFAIRILEIIDPKHSAKK